MSEPNIISVKKEKKLIPGLMTCDIDMHIAKATSDYRWTGPKISRDLWWQICSFFEWTYAEAKSESQVRLFVNCVTREWAAWAFPQEKGTGMTTKELADDPRWAEQRAQFPDPDWYYYGTVHHHCSMGAFQSGTDEANEKDQDGLHITVGKIGTLRYDFDCRLYQSKWRLPTPDMEMFWDIGPAVRSMIPPDTYNLAARYQMCEPPPKDYEFPAQWKENYIIPVRPVVVHKPYSLPPHVPERFSRLYNDDADRTPPDTDYDKRLACAQFLRWLDKQDDLANRSYEDVSEILDALGADKLTSELCRLMWVHDLSPKGMADYFGDAVLEHEMLLETKRQRMENDRDKQKDKDKDDQDTLTGEGGPHNHSDYGGMGYT